MSRNSKKIIAIIIALVVTFLIFACMLYTVNHKRSEYEHFDDKFFSYLSQLNRIMFATNVSELPENEKFSLYYEAGICVGACIELYQVSSYNSNLELQQFLEMLQDNPDKFIYELSEDEKAEIYEWVDRFCINRSKEESRRR